MKINRKQKIIVTAGIAALILMFWLMKIIVRLLNQAKETVEKRDAQIQKLNSYYYLLEHWLNMRNKGRMVERYFERNQYKQIVVYGMGKAGCLLCNELKESSCVKVLYGIDRRMGDEKYTADRKEITDDIASVDAVIVTMVGNIDNIRHELEEKYDCPIISIEDVIYSL